MRLKQIRPSRIKDSVICLGIDYFNSFLIKGTQYALLETGISCSAPFVIQQFHDLGLDPQLLQYIVIMHAHPDHVTGVPYLQEAFPWARVISSVSAQSILGKEKVVRNFLEEDNALTCALQERGSILFTPSKKEIATIQVHSTVKDGDVLDLGNNCHIQFIETPGHSKCSISAFVPLAQALFISDAGGFFSSPGRIFPCFFTGFESYLQTLHRLKDIGATVLAPAHNSVLIGNQAVREFWASAEQAALKMGQEIWGNLQDGHSQSDIVTRIVQDQYQDNLQIYSKKNIQGCVEALVKRISEEGSGFYR
jgi:glyoxylase-like metal-dependent hydrolase (beta-lactamase superfamily II)